DDIECSGSEAVARWQVLDVHRNAVGRIGRQVGNERWTQAIDKCTRCGRVADGDLLVCQALVRIDERKAIAANGWTQSKPAIRKANRRAEPHGTAVGHQCATLRSAEIIDAGTLRDAYLTPVA